MLIPNEDLSFVEILFKLVCTAFAGIAGWLWVGVTNDMKSIHKEIADMKEDSSEHKVYVEREFEKRETIQLSLARIHDRLDQLIQLHAGK